MIQNDTIAKIATGAAGLASSEIAPAVIDAVADNTNGVVQLIVQVIIGICTIIGIFKKKKSNS